MLAKQREALRQCLLAGPRKDLLRQIWRSDDLGTIRLAVRLLPRIPDPYQDRFRVALKQMSG